MIRKFHYHLDKNVITLFNLVKPSKGLFQTTFAQQHDDSQALASPYHHIYFAH